jgi:hypothetical protein
VKHPTRLPGSEAGYNSHGYIVVKLKGQKMRAHNLIWFIVTGEWPDEELDHRDRDGLNNRWENLRPATRLINCLNVGVRCDSLSGFKGVSASKRRWKARILIGGQRKCLGSFSTPQDAAKAYDQAAYAAFGDSAFLNFPTTSPLRPPAP